MSQRKKQFIRLGLLHVLRNAAFSQTTSQSSNGSNEGKQSTIFNATLKVNDILIEEYRHASAYAIQILKERTVTFNLYFLLFGISASSLGVIYQLSGNVRPYLQQIAILLLIAVGSLNAFFFTRLVYLGILYRESVIKMSVVREFYLQQFKQQMPRLKDALRSDLMFNSPDNLHPRNIQVCATLALIASLCFAGAAVLGYELLLHINNGVLLPFPSDIRPYITGLVVFMVFLFLHVIYYRLNHGMDNKLASNPGNR